MGTPPFIHMGSGAQVAGVRGWLHEHPGLRLEMRETRTFGDRGVLVLLCRPGNRPC